MDDIISPRYIYTEVARRAEAFRDKLPARDAKHMSKVYSEGLTHGKQVKKLPSLSSTTFWFAASAVDLSLHSPTLTET